MIGCPPLKDGLLRVQVDLLKYTVAQGHEVLFRAGSWQRITSRAKDVFESGYQPGAVSCKLKFVEIGLDCEVVRANLVDFSVRRVVDVAVPIADANFGDWTAEESQVVLAAILLDAHVENGLKGAVEVDGAEVLCAQDERRRVDVGAVVAV